MPVFAYRALTGGGRARGGVIGAESARAAWQELRARGVYPTELREQAAGTGWAGRRLGAEELAAATRQFATLAGAGVPVAEALAAVAEQSEHPALVRGLTVAGALATVLARLADHTEASAALRARLRAALTYPAVMAAATVAVLVFLLAWVVPQLTQLFAETGTRLPLATRLLIAVTSVVGRTWWLLLVAGAGAAWGLARWAATPAGRARLDAALLGAPLAGPIVRKAAVARFARTLETLLAGGLPLDVALGIAGAATGNCRLADAVASAREAVRQGEPLAPALRRTGVFPPLVVHLAAVGERAGALGAMLERAAAAYEREVETTISAATALVEPPLVRVMR